MYLPAELVRMSLSAFADHALTGHLATRGGAR